MSVTADVIEASRSTDPVTHDYGDQALLLEFDSTADVLAWTEAIREADLLGVLDIVPGSRTVLIKLARPQYQAPTRQRLGTLQVAAEAVSDSTGPVDGRVDVEIEVIYDGPDLDEVARLTGLTPEQVGVGQRVAPRQDNGGAVELEKQRLIAIVMDCADDHQFRRHGHLHKLPTSS